MPKMGIEFKGKDMYYVIIDDDDPTKVLEGNRITLSHTRSKDAITSFQDAVKSVFNSTAPTVLGIKLKMEAGQKAAGAAALKMEALVLANAPCDVEFVSGHKINQVPEPDENLLKYLHPAFKAAQCTLKK